MNSYSQKGEDLQLLKYLNYTGGVFIEAGANDGIKFSNTYMFEEQLGWTGLLVEPNPHYSSLCKSNRPGSIVENYALVGFDYQKETIRGSFGHTHWGESMCAQVLEIDDDGDNPIFAGWRSKSLVESILEKNKDFILDIPTVTLNHLLDKHNFSSIDLFSLDVEGYESQVFDGLDFVKYRPKYIVLEVGDKDERRNFLTNYLYNKNYDLIESLNDLNNLYIDKNII